MKKISVVIPVYNEENTVSKCYERLINVFNLLSNYDYEILFVDDGSKDNSKELLKELRNQNSKVSYLTFSRNFGKEIAIIAGLDYISGDCVIFLDCDLQDPPELIPEFIKYWEQGYDDVYARRLSRKGESFFKKFTSKLYYKILQFLAPIEIQKDTGDFRLLDKRCYNALKKMRESHRCSKSMFSWIGYNKKEITYNRDPRISGKTKWNYKKLLNLAIDGITSFTTSPLRISTILSIPTFLAFLIYLIYIIVYSIKYSTNITSIQILILITLFFFGSIILLIGIIGEYLGRIFNETKNRPLYFVDEYNGQKEENK